MRILQRGDTGSDVRLLQTALIRAGYDPGQVNGVFGAQTERAVKQFQRVLGLNEDGVVGSRTWSFLEPFALEPDTDVLRRGSRGRMVTLLQNALKEAGFNVGTADGLFGTKTRDAVRALQQAAGLPVTGVVDDATWFTIAPFIDWSGTMLRFGDRGVLVGIMQYALANAGFDSGGVDGVFGRNTQSALRAFQRANNLVDDGIAGPRTWRVLRPYIVGNVVTYTVKRGDTLSSIAKRFNTTVAEILKLNPREDPNLIYVGEVLTLPAGAVPSNQMPVPLGEAEAVER